MHSAFSTAVFIMATHGAAVNTDATHAATVAQPKAKVEANRIPSAEILNGLKTIDDLDAFCKIKGTFGDLKTPRGALFEALEAGDMEEGSTESVIVGEYEPDAWTKIVDLVQIHREGADPKPAGPLVRAAMMRFGAIGRHIAHPENMKRMSRHVS